jgi:hypothetical protein
MSTTPTTPSDREISLARCLGFFASVIKSGEGWSEQCETAYSAALTPQADHTEQTRGAAPQASREPSEAAKHVAFLDSGYEDRDAWDDGWRARAALATREEAQPSDTVKRRVEALLLALKSNETNSGYVYVRGKIATLGESIRAALGGQEDALPLPLVERIMNRIVAYAASYHVDATTGITSSDTAGHLKAIRAALGGREEAPEASAMAVLRELVDLKDMKDRLQNLHAMGHGTDYSDYHRLKPLAWAKARALVASPPPAPPTAADHGGKQS